jgi:protease-4
MDNPTFSAPAGGNATPPPPPFSPPPLMSPPPSPKPRKSYGWMIAAIILIVVLAFSLVGNVAQMAMNSLSFSHSFKNTTAREVGPRLEECVLEDNDAHSKIAVISVEGVISTHGDDGAGYNLVEIIKAQLYRAADDDAVKAVILKVDSPGGEVMASDQIYKAINDFQSDEPAEKGHPGRKGKPVICSMGSLAASGGYYIAAPCRWIVADELTLTGSIGVIMHGYNYRGLMDKVGLAPMTYKSGKFKDMLSPDRSTNDIPVEEHAMVQALIDETFQKFKGVVREGREAAHELNKKEGRPLAKDWEDYADGRVVSGTQAFNLGLVDELGDFDYAVERAMQIAHVKKANLVEYQQRYDIANFLSMFGQSGQAKDLKIDLGVNLPKLRAGYLYFLAPNFVN